MHFRLPFLPVAAAITCTLWLAPAARAKFLSPPDVLKEPELTAIVETLKKTKAPEDSKAAFASVNDLATKATSAERQFFLGYLHQYGLGTEAAVDKARDAYQKSADAGFAPAKNNLGLLNLATGADPAKAVALVEDLANTGNPAAQCSMGQLYMDGVPAAGIAKDAVKARVWFERAASSGDSDAAWTLALMIGQQPQPAEADAKQAIALMEQAVTANHLPALVEYGSRFAERILAPSERAAYRISSRPTWFVANRFAAKEALSKALGTGLRFPVTLHTISVVSDAVGKPEFRFHGAPPPGESGDIK